MDENQTKVNLTTKYAKSKLFANEKVELWKKITRTIRTIEKILGQEQKIKEKEKLDNLIQKYLNGVQKDEEEYIQQIQNTVKKVSEDLINKIKNSENKKRLNESLIKYVKDANTLIEDYKQFSLTYKKSLINIKNANDLKTLETLRTQGFKDIKVAKDKLKTSQSKQFESALNSVEKIIIINEEIQRKTNNSLIIGTIDVLILSITAIITVNTSLGSIYALVSLMIFSVLQIPLVNFLLTVLPNMRENMQKKNENVIEELEYILKKLKLKKKANEVLTQQLKIDENQAKILQIMQEINYENQRTITTISNLLNMSANIVREEMELLITKKYVEKNQIIIQNKQNFEKYYQKNKETLQGNVKTILNIIREQKEIKTKDIENAVTNSNKIIGFLQRQKLIDIKETYKLNISYINEIILDIC